MQQSLEEKLSRDAEKLIRAHDGDVALLYLYYLHTGSRDGEQAARELCRTLREIEAAQEKLERMGLLDGAPIPQQKSEEIPPAPAQKLPEYTAEDVTRRAREDGEFAAVLADAAKVLGRSLNTGEIRTLFGIYDHLGLPAEVMLELLHYCGECFLERYGTQRRPTVHAIEKEAFVWANEEILTLEQAENYIRSRRERRGLHTRIRDALDIRDRGFSASELKYIDAWLDMGFGEEAIGIAYERTVANTGARKFQYMDKILLSWHKNGLHTRKEIEEKDVRRSTRQQAEKRSVGPIDTRDLEKAFEEL